ncbi:hypothetical protein ACIQGZ_24340 [Streptomyces sp. NPDC092296]|uniref:hypothetical protein n=1 Tax=Streptomyces sp. NPDC092296 TaxID=3366012 RepID=UPI0037FE5FAE
MAGSGYRVQVENLQDFAKKVRGLLSEFDAGANGERAHADSAFAAGSLGPFAEARQLSDAYGNMREGLRDMLDLLYQAVDGAQKNADATARNYDEQEHGTAADLRYDSTGSGPAAAPPSAAAVEKSTKW